jgi:hypothetical protein
VTQSLYGHTHQNQQPFGLQPEVPYQVKDFTPSPELGCPSELACIGAYLLRLEIIPLVPDQGSSHLRLETVHLSSEIPQTILRFGALVWSHNHTHMVLTPYLYGPNTILIWSYHHTERLILVPDQVSSQENDSGSLLDFNTSSQ